MNATQIANTISETAELAFAGTISLELHGAVNATLWELATLKGLNKEVDTILQTAALEADLDF